MCIFVQALHTVSGLYLCSCAGFFYFFTWNLNHTFGLAPEVCTNQTYVSAHVFLTLKIMIFVCFPKNGARLSWKLTVHRLFTAHFPPVEAFLFCHGKRLEAASALCWKAWAAESYAATLSPSLCWVLLLSVDKKLSKVTLPWPFFMAYWPWCSQRVPASGLERPLASFIAKDMSFQMTQVKEEQLCACQWIYIQEISGVFLFCCHGWKAPVFIVPSPTCAHSSTHTSMHRTQEKLRDEVYIFCKVWMMKEKLLRQKCSSGIMCPTLADF